MSLADSKTWLGPRNDADACTCCFGQAPGAWARYSQQACTIVWIHTWPGQRKDLNGRYPQASSGQAH
eukprot:5490563-Amphidinium_carterae.1